MTISHRKFLVLPLAEVSRHITPGIAEPMRVLTINTSYSTGGAASVASTLHQNMLRQPRICPVFLSGRGKMVPTDNIITLNQHHLYAYADALAYRLIAKEGVFSKNNGKWILEKLLPNIDIVHIHNIHGYYIHASIMDLVKEIPVVWTLHDMWIATGRCAFPYGCSEWIRSCEHCLYGLTNYPRTWLVRDFKNDYTWKRDLLKRIKYLTLVVPSRSFLEKLHNMKINVDDVKIIHNGIDTNVFKPVTSLLEKQHIVRRLGLPNDNLPIVCFVARRVFEPRKNFAILRRSLLNWGREVRLLIIGESSHRMEQSHFSSCIQIVYRGYIEDRNVLRDYLRISDVVVNPSEDETFGLTSLEALSCGARPVVFRLPIFQEVLGKWAVYADSISSESLRVAILQSLERPLSLQEKQDAHEYVRDRFSLENMCESYLNLYRQVIDKTGSAG